MKTYICPKGPNTVTAKYVMARNIEENLTSEVQFELSRDRYV